MVKGELLTQCVDRLHAYEDKHGLRHTSERDTILRIIIEHQEAFSPKELYEWVVPCHISRATVYNTLELLTSAQILQCLRNQTNSKRLQYMLTLESTNHIQLKCIRCGRVSNIKDSAIKKLIFDRHFSNFVTSHYSLYVYGTCRTCKMKKIEI